MPQRPIPKSRAGTSILAHVIVQKFEDHLPLYRQAKMFIRQGIDTLSEQTITDNLHQCAQLLKPLVGEIKSDVLASGYVQSDDTPIKVKDPKRPGKTQLSYLYSYLCPTSNEVVYDYQLSHSRDGPNDFLKHYQGYLQTDCHGCYVDLSKVAHIKRLYCWAHLRRKVEEALDENVPLCGWILYQIQQLYRIEKHCNEKGFGPNLRHWYRQSHSQYIVKRLKKALMKLKPRAQDNFRKAINYALEHWDGFETYLQRGDLHIDNNSCERTMRPIGIGRKNYLHIGHPSKGENYAILYTLIENCRRQHINSFDYLKNVLDRIVTHPKDKLKELTPKNWKKSQSK